MQFSNGKIRVMVEAIQSLMNTKISGQAAIDLVANARLLRQATVDVEEAQKAILMAIPGFAAYEDRRVALCTRYASRLPTGQPMVRNASYVMTPQNREAFNRELAALDAEHAEVVAAREARMPELNGLLELTTDLPLKRIRRSQIIGAIEPRVIDALWEIIDMTQEVEPDENG